MSAVLIPYTAFVSVAISVSTAIGRLELDFWYDRALGRYYLGILSDRVLRLQLLLMLMDLSEGIGPRGLCDMGNDSQGGGRVMWTIWLSLWWHQGDQGRPVRCVVRTKLTVLSGPLQDARLASRNRSRYRSRSLSASSNDSYSSGESHCNRSRSLSASSIGSHSSGESHCNRSRSLSASSNDSYSSGESH